MALPFISVGRNPPKRTGARPNAVRDLAAGATYVWRSPGIRACCVAIIAIAGIGSPLFSFLPASFGQRVFGLSKLGIGVLSGAGGVGALVVAPLLLTRLADVSRAKLLVWAMSAYGLGVVLVGVAPNVWLAVVAGAVFGGSYLAIAAAINTTIQLLAAEEMRGKCIAFYIACLTGSLPIGLFLWGRAADQYGIRATAVAAGALLIMTTAVLAVTGRFTAMESADSLM